MVNEHGSHVYRRTSGDDETMAIKCFVGEFAADPVRDWFAETEAFLDYGGEVGECRSFASEGECGTGCRLSI